MAFKKKENAKGSYYKNFISCINMICGDPNGFVILFIVLKNL